MADALRRRAQARAEIAAISAKSEVKLSKRFPGRDEGWNVGGPGHSYGQRGPRIYPRGRKILVADCSGQAGRSAVASRSMRSAYKSAYKLGAIAVLVIAAGLGTASFLTGQAPSGGDRLEVYGDVVYFLGPDKPHNCTANSQFKKGEPVGFRMTALDPATGKRDRATQLVVHLTYNGKTVDLPMRDRETAQQPDHNFWVLKWIVPDDATTGVVRYTVTAKDPQGRTGEFKPFDVAASQLTIVE